MLQLLYFCSLRACHTNGQMVMNECKMINATCSRHRARMRFVSLRIPFLSGVGAVELVVALQSGSMDCVIH